MSGDTPVACDYCKKPARLVNGRKLYPHRQDLFDKKFYQCEPCDAHVGCHPGTEKPLGRLANPGLRQAKIRAHGAFDPIWRSGRTSRGHAYKLLAEQLGIIQEDCHIGMFDVDMCNRVVEAVNVINSMPLNAHAPRNRSKHKRSRKQKHQ